MMLWKPSEQRIRNSNFYDYQEFLRNEYDLSFSDYTELYRWSVNKI